MMIAIASGKGGTGKTTLAVNLAHVVASSVQLLDCDVEAPNGHLFVKGESVAREEVTTPLPEVEEARCSGCGECSAFCAFHALAVVGCHVLVFPELCHGCGGCTVICPEGAIRERPQPIGVIETFRKGQLTLTHGRLHIGVASATPLIRAVKNRARDGALVLVDCPPGTSCPVVASLRDVDGVMLVAEPTPFGLHDLRLMVEVVRALRLPCGVVVNRAGMGDDRVHTFCREEGIPLLGEIPEERRIAEAYARGDVLVEVIPGYRARMVEILGAMSALVRGGSHP